MARHKSARKFSDVIQAAPGRECRRSLEAPLLWIGVALFAGFPILRDATSEPMLRNRYGNDLRSCECDYGQDRCVRQDGG